MESGYASTKDIDAECMEKVELRECCYELVIAADIDAALVTFGRRRGSLGT